MTEHLNDDETLKNIEEPMEAKLKATDSDPLLSNPSADMPTLPCPPKKHAKWCYLFCLFALLVITAFALLSYFVWQLHEESQQSLVEANGMNIRFDRVQQNVTAQTEQIQAQKADIARLIKSHHYQKRDWVLFEVENLVQLAHFSLQAENNIPNAIYLLNTALQRLELLANPAASDLINRIKSVLEQLKSITPVNMENIVLQLNQTGQQIYHVPDILAALSNPAVAPSPEKNNKISSAVTNWLDGLKQSFEKLKSLIIIKRHDKPVNASTIQYDRIYLDQHFQLCLEQAKWALLHQNKSFYEASLDDAINWLKQYYAHNIPQTNQIKQALLSLKAINIQPDYPNLDHIMTDLHKMLMDDSQVTLQNEQG